MKRKADVMKLRRVYYDYGGKLQTEIRADRPITFRAADGAEFSVMATERGIAIATLHGPLVISPESVNLIHVRIP